MQKAFSKEPGSLNTWVNPTAWRRPLPIRGYPWLKDFFNAWMLPTLAFRKLPCLQRRPDDPALAVIVTPAQRGHRAAQIAKTMFGKRRGNVALRLGGEQ